MTTDGFAFDASTEKVPSVLPKVAVVPPQFASRAAVLFGVEPVYFGWPHELFRRPLGPQQVVHHGADGGRCAGCSRARPLCRADRGCDGCDCAALMARDEFVICTDHGADVTACLDTITRLRHRD